MAKREFFWRFGWLKPPTIRRVLQAKQVPGEVLRESLTLLKAMFHKVGPKTEPGRPMHPRAAHSSESVFFQVT